MTRTGAQLRCAARPPGCGSSSGIPTQRMLLPAPALGVYSVCARVSVSARQPPPLPPPPPFLSILMCGLAFGHLSPPPCPHRDWSVQRKERDFSVSVCDFAPKPGILSLCLCLVPISRAQRSHLLPLCSGTIWPHAEVCVPHSWDTSRLFWPDCPWQWVCCCRWLMASVPPLAPWAGPAGSPGV